MSPPIRGAGTAAKLRGGLAGGPLSIVATDHAVFNSTQKRAGRHDFRFIDAVFHSPLLCHLASSLLLEGTRLCWVSRKAMSCCISPKHGSVLTLQEDTKWRERH